MTATKPKKPAKAKAKTEDIHISVPLAPSLHDKLQQYCASQRWSKAAAARYLIETGIAKHEELNPA